MSTLQYSFDLTKLNTLHLSSIANSYIQLNSLHQLTKIRELLPKFPCYFVLGGGSNIILPETYPGLVIHNQLRGIEIVAHNDAFKLVTAYAGENWDNFIAFCVKNGCYGLENLSLIPGSVGASPVQNIGAYGVEVKDFIDSVSVYDWESGEIRQYSNQECQFEYRNSFFKNKSRYLVISVTFKLATQAKLNLSYGDISKCMAAIDHPTAEDLRNCIIAIRQNKLPDPCKIANAGSFFHNPIIPKEHVQKLLTQFPKLPAYPTNKKNLEKVSAGWLIDNLGLKGFQKENLAIYEKQALVIVNYGQANQTELLTFARLIQEQIFKHYQINLNIEPIIL